MHRTQERAVWEKRGGHTGSRLHTMGCTECEIGEVYTSIRVVKSFPRPLSAYALRGRSVYTVSTVTSDHAPARARQVEDEVHATLALRFVLH